MTAAKPFIILRKRDATSLRIGKIVSSVHAFRSLSLCRVMNVEGWEGGHDGVGVGVEREKYRKREIGGSEMEQEMERQR